MTIKINLLAWRQIQRRKEKQQFITVAASGLILVVLVCLLVNCSVFGLIVRQQNYNKGLQKNLAILDAKINEISKIKNQKRVLLKRILFLLNLQNSRIVVVRFFDELIKLIPEGVNLDIVRSTGKKITLEGVSKSNFALSLLMKNIEQNPWMQSPNLVEIKNIKPLVASNHFSLSFVLKPKKTENLNL